MSPTDPTSHDSAVAALMRRVAAAAGVHMYEMELHDDGSYVCTVWITTALQSLLGGVPDGIGDEEAWEQCIHPDDREAYEASYPPLRQGMATETEYRLIGYDGVVRWVWERCVPRAVSDGRLLVDGIVTDITDRHRVEAELAAAHGQLAHLAYHDHLTGLPNRAQFQTHLDRALALARRDGGAVAVLFIDLDGFKDINDRFGHAAGDSVLCEVARRLSELSREGDLVARLGGDEFLLLAPLADAGAAAAEVLRRRVLDCLSEPLEVEGELLQVTGSVGAALFPDHADGGEELIQTADLAMYADKQRGAGRAA